MVLTAHGLAYWWGLATLVEKWGRSDGYYGHGPLAVAFAAWAWWRTTPRNTPPDTRPVLGFGSIALGGALLGYARWRGISVFEHWALLVSLLGTCFLVLGGQAVRKTWFAWCFLLLFAIPLPNTVLDYLTLWLKLLTTEGCHQLLLLIGAPVVREGGTILFPDAAVRVDDLCSGMRSIVALSAMAAALGFLQASPLRRGLLVTLTLPIAVLANGVRVGVLSFCALRQQTWAFADPWHSASGVFTYGVALICLLAVAGTLPRGSSPAGQIHVALRSLSTAIVSALLCGGIGLFLFTQRALREHVAGDWDRPSVTARIPLRLGDWRGSAIERTELDLPRKLRTKDFVVRQYARADGATAEVFALFSERPELGIHGPRICYQLQGFEELEHTRIALGPAGADSIQVGRVLIRHEWLGDLALLYYCFPPGPGSATLRISTAVKGNQIAAADLQLQSLLQQDDWALLTFPRMAN